MKKLNPLSTCTALTILAAAFAGCTGPGKATKAATPAANLISGRVLETVDSGGYTYINLEKDGKNTWVAAPVMKVSVGQEVQLLPGAEMPNFNSKTLNRTFDKIIFSGGQVPGTAKPGPAAAPAKNDGLEEAAEVIMAGKVIETMNAANYSYLRIEKDGKAAWAAVPATDLLVGDEIELMPGTAMGKFVSKTMHRTFNSIYFAGGVKVTSRKVPAPAAAPAAPAAAPAAAALPEGHPKLEASPEPAAPAAATVISGKVVETANAGGYTYLCLEKGGGKTWVAVPTMQVELGQEIVVNGGAVMTNFSSKTLNRTFEKIVFSSGPAAK